MKKGFTLLELIVVIIILGILATLGFVQYASIIEKGRRAEAASLLGTMRRQSILKWQESGNTYIDNVYVSVDLGLPIACATTAPSSQYYFAYTTVSGTGISTATRCTTGGKTPAATTVTTMTLAVDGTKTGPW